MTTMLEYLPSTALRAVHGPPTLDATRVFMWGLKEDYVRSSYECLGMGSLRFMVKGSRETAMMPMEHAQKTLKGICDAEESPYRQEQLPKV